MITSTNDNPIWEEDEGDELDRLLDYARQIRGDRAVHSVYEVLDLIPPLRQQNLELAAALEYVTSLSLRIPARIVRSGDDETEYEPDPRAVALFGAENLMFEVGAQYQSCYRLLWQDTFPERILSAHDAELRRKNVELATELTKALAKDEAVGDTLDELCPGWQGDYPDVIRALARDRDELAAALQTAIREGCDCDLLYGKICRIHRLEGDSGTILAAHDAALVRPLLDVLQKFFMLASHNGLCASRRIGDPPCDCGFDEVDAALAAHRKMKEGL